MKKLTFLTAGACAVALQASADFVTYLDSFGPSATDFSDTLILPKFDPQLGDLCAVTYTFRGFINGEVLFDSENPQPSTIKVRISGTIMLKDGATTLVSLAPIDQAEISVTGDNEALDGFPSPIPRLDTAPDYIGTDAGSYSKVVGQVGVVNVPVGDLPLFISSPGDTTVNWSVEAVGDSNASGSGNLGLFIGQDAGGSVEIRYEYNCVVPETSTYLAGLGLIGMAVAATRRFGRR